MQKKLVMLFIAILLAFVILVGRITYINASSGEDYTKTVLDQQQYMSRSIPFKRGDIVDTNGTKLATSERVYNVILDAKVLLSDETKKAENIAATKKALKSYFQIKASAVGVWYYLTPAAFIAVFCIVFDHNIFAYLRIDLQDLGYIPVTILAEMSVCLLYTSDAADE